MEFKSTNNLDFEIADWHISSEFKRFRVGTCTGLWNATKESYQILAIGNDKPGNGHFTDVLEWFENSAKRDVKSLKILEVWNNKLKKHLTEKRGFVDIGNDNLEKVFTKN